MRRQTILAAFMLSAALLTACGGTEEKSTPENTADTASPSKAQSSGSDDLNNIGSQTILENNDNPDSGSGSGELSVIPDEEMLQQLYDKAPEYEYLALGYYQDPNDPTMVRDGYVPFDENFVQESTDYLKSAAHGVSIRLYMVKADNATDANKECALIYNEGLVSRGISAEFQDASSFDNNTLALSPVIYQNESDETIVAFLYSDIRDDGTIYMCAEIELNEAKFDESTLALVEEMDDAYSMTFSSMFYD